MTDKLKANAETRRTAPGDTGLVSGAASDPARKTGNSKLVLNQNVFATETGLVFSDPATPSPLRLEPETPDYSQLSPDEFVGLLGDLLDFNPEEVMELALKDAKRRLEAYAAIQGAGVSENDSERNSTRIEGSEKNEKTNAKSGIERNLK